MSLPRKRREHQRELIIEQIGALPGVSKMAISKQLKKPLEGRVAKQPPNMQRPGPQKLGCLVSAFAFKETHEKKLKAQDQCNVYKRERQLVLTLNSEMMLLENAPVRLTTAQLEELNYEKLYLAYSP